ncbi:TPA: hypothetical protein ACJIWE_000720 [Enterobacter roggenkampii]
MSNIDKQAVQAVADLKAGYTLGYADVAILNELARIALASLEAEPAIHRWRRVTSEPYGPYPWHYGDFIGFSKPVDGIEDEYFYSAPPEPANAEPVAWIWSHRKHPSEVTLIRPEDDERAEGAHWSGWSCQALYAAQPASAAMKDHQIRELVNKLRDIAVEYHGTQQLRERIARTIRAAMLQGAENADSPTTMQTAPSLDSSQIIAESPSGNSPVIPDAYDIEAFGIFSATEGENGLMLQIERFRFGTEKCPQIGKENMVPKFALQGVINRLQDHCDSMENEALVDILSTPAAPQQEVKS